MVITIIVLSLFLIVSLFLIRNSIKIIKKQEQINNDLFEEKELYKNQIIDFSELIRQSSIRLIEIDKRGAYSSDDEIGWFFNQIKTIQDKLNNFIPKN